MSYDIFNLIRSKEIREHFRKYSRMNMKQKLSLVVKSYVDIPLKIKCIKQLEYEAKGNDRKLAEEMVKYLEIGYNGIVHPDTSALYIVNKRYCDQPDDTTNSSLKDRMGETEEYCLAYQTNYADVISFLESERHYRVMGDGKSEEQEEFIERGEDKLLYWEGQVDQINFPFRAEKKDSEYYNYCEDWNFWVAWMNGKWFIRAFDRGIWRDDDVVSWYAKQGISEEILDIVNPYACDWHFEHKFTLPFERGERLKLQTPLMDNPVIGIYDPCYTGENHLYLCAEDEYPKEYLESRNELEPPDCDSLLISYQMLIFHDTTFCLWDWLERA